MTILLFQRSSIKRIRWLLLRVGNWTLKNSKWEHPRLKNKFKLKLRKKWLKKISRRESRCCRSKKYHSKGWRLVTSLSSQKKIRMTRLPTISHQPRMSIWANLLRLINNSSSSSHSLIPSRIFTRVQTKSLPPRCPRSIWTSMGRWYLCQ